MRMHRWRGVDGLVAGLLALIVLTACWGRPLPPDFPPTATRVPPLRTRMPTMVVATRVPAPAPIPTISPLSITRSVSAPEPPELLVVESAVVNVTCLGECVNNGAASWVTSDTQLGWTHPDPLSADYYEVWMDVDEGYWTPETCSGCELVGTTTGLETIIADAPNGFNPVGGSEGADIMSRVYIFQVRACNAGGCSEPSNEIGTVNYSLLQGMSGAEANALHGDQ